jgi:hypothetical protein
MEEKECQERCKNAFEARPLGTRPQGRTHRLFVEVGSKKLEAGFPGMIVLPSFRHLMTF